MDVMVWRGTRAVAAQRRQQARRRQRRAGRFNALRGGFWGHDITKFKLFEIG
jgi:hypothetical protein